MSFAQFLRILKGNFLKMLASGLVMAGLVYVLIKDQKPTYSSHTVLNTGLVTGYNLERGSSMRVDMNFAENEMGNLINLSSSNEILEELCLQLMATYFTMSSANDPSLISPENWIFIEENKEKLAALLLDFNQSPTAFYQNLLVFRNQVGDNALKDLLFSKDKFFGVNYLKSALRVRQEGQSDLIRIEYSTIDAGVCQHTLEKHTELFVAKKMRMNETQSKSVLEFFEKATSESAAELRAKEDELLAFTVKNKIINYYEQTRYIAAEKEDLDDLYFKERMDKAASDSTLIHLERELNKRVNLPELNKQVDGARKELGIIHAKIAKIEALELPSEQDDLHFLKDRAQLLKSEMEQRADAILVVRRTPEGVDMREILSKWLERTLQKEITAARLNVFGIRKREFDDTYARFAPWGSKLKRMEREINVAERAYLENLHSYNQALLHQFNTTLAGGLTIVDAPAYPAKAEGSNMKLTLIATALVGMFLALTMALALEIFDSTLKSPTNAAEITKLPLAGALPLLLFHKKTDVLQDKVLDKALFQVAQSILRELDKNSGKTIGLLSMLPGEGKSFVQENLLPMLTEIGLPKSSQIIELPALMEATSKKAWAKQVDLALLVASADRVWSAADDHTLELYKSRQSAPLFLLLNKTNPDRLDETLGEIPRERSIFRKKLKAFLEKIGIR